MSFFMANKQQSELRYSMMTMNNVRSFSSNLPPHVKLEMPNLSPTMEKVRRLQLQRMITELLFIG
jgi:hypothetical protein